MTDQMTQQMEMEMQGADNEVRDLVSLVRFDEPKKIIDPEETQERPSEEDRKDLISPANLRKEETEKILNAILPPRNWEENGQQWQQLISSQPSNRQEVIRLEESLVASLQATQARERGICPLRRNLYTQCFDEIIRQVTTNCAERGLLLLRCRDEIAMTLEAYETLYMTSVEYGMHKAMSGHEEKEFLRERLKEFSETRAPLDATIADLKMKTEQTELRNAEIRAVEERKYLEEIAFLKKSIVQMKAQIEAIINPKK